MSEEIAAVGFNLLRKRAFERRVKRRQRILGPILAALHRRNGREQREPFQFVGTTAHADSLRRHSTILRDGNQLTDVFDRQSTHPKRRRIQSVRATLCQRKESLTAIRSRFLKLKNTIRSQSHFLF